MDFQSLQHRPNPFALSKIRLWTGLVAGVIFAALGIWISIHPIIPVESDVMVWLQQVVPTSVGGGLKFAYYAGDVESSAIVVAFTLGLLIWKRKWREALFFAIATAGALVWVDLVFKPLFSRERPPFFTDPTINGAAFPSGHATGNILMYFFLAFLFSTRFPQHLVWINGAAVLWIILMGLGCVYNGVHWPTDVLGGYSLGITWLMICLTGFFWRQKRSKV